MGRSLKAAKNAGTRFERLVADYLNQHVDDRIDRRVKTGALDKGDIAGVRAHGQRVVIECKDKARISVGEWIGEAEAERVNDAGLAGMVAYKRIGRGAPGDQLVVMTLADLAALLSGQRPPISPPATAARGTQEESSNHHA